MSSLSLSGKSWFLKKYNQEDLTYIKDNYSLDEITSKLLSIRKIKKDDINSFLNPTLKNFIPNQGNRYRWNLKYYQNKKNFIKLIY